MLHIKSLELAYQCHAFGLCLSRLASLFTIRSTRNGVKAVSDKNMGITCPFFSIWSVLIHKLQIFILFCVHLQESSINIFSEWYSYVDAFSYHMIWLLLDIGGRAYIRSRHTVHHTFPSLYKIIMCMTYASFFCNQSGSRKSLFLKPYRERAPAFFILLHIVCCAGGLMASVTASANGSQDGDIPDPAFPAAFLLSSLMAISWFYGALP